MQSHCHENILELCVKRSKYMLQEMDFRTVNLCILNHFQEHFMKQIILNKSRRLNGRMERRVIDHFLGKA